MEVNLINLQKRIQLTPFILLNTKKAVRETLSFEAAKLTGHANICLVDDQKITRFNKKYFGTASATDVIAFEISGNSRPLKLQAEIIISTEAAYRNAKIYKTSPDYELFLYVIHGMLHTLGYEDNTEKKRKIMRDKAMKILTKLNLNANP